MAGGRHQRLERSSANGSIAGIWNCLLFFRARDDDADLVFFRVEEMKDTFDQWEEESKENMVRSGLAESVEMPIAAWIKINERILILIDFLRNKNA